MQTPRRVVIIGGGPGGYVAALRAAQLGKRVVLIEKEKLGGTCLNRGCIPTKTVLRSAHLLMEMRRAAEFGVEIDSYRLNVDRLMARKRAVVDRLRSGVQALLRRAGVEVISGRGVIVGPNEVMIEGTDEKVLAEAIIIATGSVPKALPVGEAGRDYVLSDWALEFDSVPNSVVVVGGGAVGVEYVTIFAALGAEVYLVEILPEILPGTDKEIVGVLRQVLAEMGVKVLTGTSVVKIESGTDTKRVLVKGEGGKESELAAEYVVVAVGRVPNTEGLGLECVGVETTNGWVTVDEALCTSVPGIYAIGDVVGGYLLAHVASHQGIVAAENVAGAGKKMDYRYVPRCIFTMPEIASIGLTEEEASERYGQVTTASFPFAANGKALADGESRGFVKLVADKKYGEILGVHMIGPQASQLIGEALMLTGLEGTVHELAHIIHPHPTLTEVLMEAAHKLLGRPIHI